MPYPTDFHPSLPPADKMSKREYPAGRASRAPAIGNTSQAKTPCVSQKLSHDHDFTFFIGTYELDCPILPIAMIIRPMIAYIALFS
jgi:hypothetical protein